MYPNYTINVGDIGYKGYIMNKEKTTLRKEKVQTFLEGYYLMIVDDLIGAFGYSRSEVIREIVKRWIDSNPDKIKAAIERKKEAQERGYL